jgi:hypothetical protein
MSSAFGVYLAQPVRARVAVIGDSNAALIAGQAVQAAQRVTTGAAQPTVMLDYIGAVPGISLGDLPNLLTRLGDAKVAIGSRYDACLINIGVNDILNVSNANWANYYAGSFPGGSGMYYRARVKAVLDAIPGGVRVYWIGIPTGQTFQPTILTFQKILQVDVGIATFDNAWVNAGPVEASYPAQARFTYLHPDQYLGLINPKFRDGLHYSDQAAIALYNAAVAKIVSDFP